MAGFDNGTLQGGVWFQAKQFGPIMRGLGPPVLQSGVVGDLYIDTQTWFLYSKRSSDQGGDVDPWGHYLFQVPIVYRSTLKWFSAYPPGNDVGVPGDYCLLWAGWTNYGMQPSIFGPKQATSWPESGDGGTLPIAVAGAGTVLPVGLADEGAPLTMSVSTQLISVGLTDEYIVAVPVAINAGDPVVQQGLRSGPAAVAVTLNPQYTAEDQLAVGAPTVSARLPAAAANVPILTSDVEVGINTSSAPTSCPLPSVAAWIAANPSGFELTIFDDTGQGATNNITPVLNGTDVFTQGVVPVITDNFGRLSLRPIITGGANQWFVRSLG